MPKTLVVILGPTGVGKTELSLRVAEKLGCPIVSCDSRQIYREIPIGTAAPNAEEQARVKHYFIGTHSLREDYNAGQYERDALQLLERLFKPHDTVVMTGGSMLYIDAVCQGLDDIPTVPVAIRERVASAYRERGLSWLQAEVQRPFRVLKIGLRRERAELYDRINRRVLQMVDDGLEQEARQVYPLREQNSLQTVGYREMFGYVDGEYDLPRAVELIQQNSRHYAKRQMTWFNKDQSIHWLDANNDYETNCNSIFDLLRNDRLQED